MEKLLNIYSNTEFMVKGIGNDPVHFTANTASDFKILKQKKFAIIIRGETSKSKRDQTLPIHSTLMFHLSEYIKERNILCYKTEFLIIG